MDPALVLVLAIAAYFLPTIIALFRRKRNWLPIMLVNIVCGWTIVLWFPILIWSLLKDS